MHPFEHALILILLIAFLSVVGRWLPWPQLITYILGGFAAALVPGFPRMGLDPDFFFLCFLPPLLFVDGWLMPLREFLRAKRPIFLLAFGLVVTTTVVIGFLAHALVPGLPLAMGFALGAIISPTDAVAVNAITERLRVPARLVTILNGESLMNDATGLVAFRFALGALVVGGFSVTQVALDFAAIALGGGAIGFAVSYIIGRVQDLVRHVGANDHRLATTFSLMTPFAAYLAAEAAHVSGVLAVVVAGLYAGWRDPMRSDPEARQSAYAVWQLVIYWLNGVAFVILGLQIPSLLSAVNGHYTTGQLIGFPLAISGAAILVRFLWVFPGTYLPLLVPSIRRSERVAPVVNVIVAGWAGMRGTVTLAAALSIPLALPNGEPFPGRDIVIFLAFGVIAVTLLLQGTTLEWLIHRLRLQDDTDRPKEERLARTTAVEAGLQALRAMEAEATTPDHAAALGRVIAEYESRVAALTAQGETRASARRRRRAEHKYRSIALQAERAAIDDLWRRDEIADEVHHPLQVLLDHEESMLKAITIPVED